MSRRRVWLFARVSLSAVALGAGLSGCAGNHESVTGSTASLSATVQSLAGLGRPSFPADAGRAREEAIIAQAIAAHEMRNP